MDSNHKFLEPSCGVIVTDIDYSPGIDVHKSLTDTISKIKASHPDIKVLISDLTPRKDVKDHEVITCNQMLNDSVKGSRNGTLIKHDNLRDNEYTHLYDRKHIKKRSVPLFVSNIK